MFLRRLSSTALAALLALAACRRVGEMAGRDAGPGGVAIDPNRPGDLVFADALLAHDNAERAMMAGFSLERQNRMTEALAQFQIASDGFATARSKFDAFAASWCSPSTNSIRCDHAAYLAGRSSYERGKLLKSPAEWTDAVTRLEAMQAAYPSSMFIDRAAYFEGRSQLELKQWDLARALFTRSIATNPAGTYADNSQFYLGKSWFLQGLALLVPTQPPPGSPDSIAAAQDFTNADAELRKVFSAYPMSKYVVEARYFIGRIAFERPYDPAQIQVRIANLNEAMDWYNQVIAGATTFVAAAHYQRGRCHYDLAIDLGSGGAFDQPQLTAGLVDFKLVPPPDAYADHALYHVSKSYVHTSTPLCTGGTDPAPSSACAAYDALKQLAATHPLYATTPYLQKTQTYVQTNYPSCACAW
jgi:TolA-binding protein